MGSKNCLVRSFSGARIRLESTKSFDALLAELWVDIGSKPAPVNEIALEFSAWDSYEAEIARYVGPSGFMLLGLFDHGAWINKAGVNRKAMRVILGNPLIAVTMLRHDLTAGLFVPVELLIIEEDEGQSSLTYIRPSSLMIIEPNPLLFEAARALDTKLEALAIKLTSP